VREEKKRKSNEASVSHLAVRRSSSFVPWKSSGFQTSTQEEDEDGEEEGRWKSKRRERNLGRPSCKG